MHYFGREVGNIKQVNFLVHNQVKTQDYFKCFSLFEQPYIFTVVSLDKKLQVHTEKLKIKAKQQTIYTNIIWIVDQELFDT